MTFQGPSPFGRIDTDNAPTKEHVLCVKAFKAVLAANIFNESVFETLICLRTKIYILGALNARVSLVHIKIQPHPHTIIDSFIQLYEIGVFVNFAEEFKINI